MFNAEKGVGLCWRGEPRAVPVEGLRFDNLKIRER